MVAMVSFRSVFFMPVLFPSFIVSFFSKDWTDLQKIKEKSNPETELNQSALLVGLFSKFTYKLSKGKSYLGLILDGRA